MTRNVSATRMLIVALAATIGVTCAGCRDGQGGPGGNGRETVQPIGQVVELTAVTMGVEPASGVETFYEQLDALTIRDLNARIRFEYIPWGDEKNQIGRAIVAKEYDLYVGGGWSDFSTFASKNAFADLTPLLEEVPRLVEHYKGALDRVTIDGKLYGIPQYGKPGAGGEGMLFREDLRKAWGLPEIRDLASAEQYLYKAKERYPDVPMINDKRFADNLWTIMTAGKYDIIIPNYAVAEVDKPYRAISMYDTPEYRDLIAKTKQWYDDGIVDHDILAAQGNETGKTLELMKADRKPLEFNNHFGAVNSGYIVALKRLYPEHEYGWYDYLFDTYPERVFLSKMSAGTSTMISIGSHSRYRETALKFIELAHTNDTYYNLLQFGVDGENYHLIDGTVTYEGIEDDNRRVGWTGLYDGYMNPRETYPGEWQPIYDKLVNVEGPELAERNGTHPYEGFVFNALDLAAEISAMETVRSQYVLPLATGISDNIDEDLEEVQRQLAAAGMERYMKELQAQLDMHAGKHGGKEG